MKKHLNILIVLFALAASSVIAQTNPPVPTPIVLPTNAPAFFTPLFGALDFLGHGSNWMISPYAIYDSGTKSMGGGVAALYKINDFLAPTLRLDEVGGSLFMPSGNVTVQVPITLMGKVTVIPFGFGGIATPLAGKAKANSSLVGVMGIGMAARVSTHFDVVADWEQWTSFKGDQFRFGLLYKF